MTTVEEALAAMDAAEQLARGWREHGAVFDSHWKHEMVNRWARDRLRLIARDRLTLERHTDHEYPTRDMRPGGSVYVVSHRCGDGNRPCKAARDVIDYWQEDASPFSPEPISQPPREFHVDWPTSGGDTL